jgi:4-hydroxy-2-oxoheptanedioate aldolase
MKMRRSRVLHKLRQNEVVNCFKLNLADGRAAEIAARAGFDCIWVCMEHVANDWEVIERQIWASKAYDTDVMVRISRGGYSDYVRPLELDAAGIMVPHLMGVGDAKQVVRMTRFHPVGRRPVDGGNADGAYAAMDFKEYLRQANEERFVAVQIEDPEPLDELDDIASLDGIDMLFFGPGDFSHGIGVPGEWDHPKILEARKRVAESALAHGKFAGTVGGLWNLEELIAMGYRFINLGADVLALTEYTRNLLKNFHDMNL